MRPVSICIPAYNNSVSLKRLLNSIFTQTHQEFEVIITDDSSDFAVENLVRTYDQAKIIYFKNEKRLGAVRNWNESISKASYEYIKIMHHDDWFSANTSLASFVSMLENNSLASFAFCGSHQYRGDSSYSRHILKEQYLDILQNPMNLFMGNSIGAPSAIIFKKSLIEFDVNLTWLVDIDFYIRYLKINPVFVMTTQPLVSIEMSDTQLTTQCLADKKLILFEYSYLFHKFTLSRFFKIKNYYLNYLDHNDVSVFSLTGTYISILDWGKYRIETFLRKFSRKIKRRISSN